MAWRRSRPGGELTRIEAVGRSGLTVSCCVARRRSGMSRRDLIGAWQRPEQAVSAGRPLSDQVKGDEGDDRARCDMHKRSHTIAAVAAASGALLGEKTVQVGDRGFVAALEWARG